MKQPKSWNRRKSMAAAFALSLFSLLAVTLLGALLGEAAAATDLTRGSMPPSLAHPFGTDWLGRDMLARTLAGLSLSIRIGLLTASVSAVIALLLGAAAALGRAADLAVAFLIDLAMGVPHILLLILISFAAGRGFWGVVVGMTLTHWMALARVLRAEILQLSGSGYVRVAAKLGQSRRAVVARHMLPHLAPQFTVGLVLLFPHAILHEASVTFLGFGLPPDRPAIGVILSESMRYLITGQWWLSLFPGLALVAAVALFDFLGGALRSLLDPASAHE